jgi:putative transposase
MIEELSVQFSIKECCVALSVSRSGYYQWVGAEPSLRAKAEEKLLEQIVEVFEANKERYGSPRVTRELRQQGVGCGENRVARLMRENELAARRKKAFRPRTTIAGEKVAPNLIKDLEPSAPNQIWVSDITYVGTLEGWLYLAVILDLFSRKVVGWKLGDTLQAELVVAALKNALVLRQPEPGLYFHSDQGSQYSSAALRKPLTVIGANLSMSAQGNCYENAKAEAFFSTLKGECFPESQVFDTKAQARREIFEYVEIYYNNVRLHSALNYQTPSQYETTFSRVIDNAISSPQSIDTAPEDRALQGCNSSADAALQTAGVAASRRYNLAPGRSCRSKPKAKNPRGFGGQSHPIPSTIH